MRCDDAEWELCSRPDCRSVMMFGATSAGFKVVCDPQAEAVINEHQPNMRL